MVEPAPENFGKFRITAQLGQGGFATVYKAVDTTLDREVALKVLDPLLLRDETFLPRFQREAKAAARLKHPHIVTVYEIGEHGGQHFIAMDYLPGPDLGRLIARQGALEPAEAVRLAGQIASALDHAHGQGLIHRDVKPANVLLDERGQAVLTDFGIAKAVGQSTVLTRTGTSIGTPQYMPPEQWTTGRVDARSDVYAFGIMVYRMLTGQVPFDGETSRIMYGHLHETPPPPQALNPALPPGVEPVLAKALAKEPGARYPTASAFVQALERALAAVPGRVETTEAAPARPEARPPRAGIPAIVWVAGAVVLLALGVVGGAALFVPRPTPTPQVVERVVTATPHPAAATAPPVLPTSTLRPSTSTPRPQAGAVRRERDGMEMVHVPAGEFLMGSTDADSDADDDEKPQHAVYLDEFWIDRTEVTNAQYEKCVAAGACGVSKYAGNSKYNGAQQPVVGVSWSDAEAYCQWAGGRLPTEAEWEKAARGTDGHVYPWGNTFDGSKLNFCDRNCERDWKDTGADDGYVNTAPVGSYPAGASSYGALDMAGNVWEWVADWYGSGYYGRSPARNPQGPDSGDWKVLRGGSWFNSRGSARCAYRYRYYPGDWGLNVGFRCARSSP